MSMANDITVALGDGSVQGSGQGQAGATNALRAALLDAQGSVKTLVIPIPTLAALANAQTMDFLIGENGTIIGGEVVAGFTPPSTAAKLATLTLSIGNVAVTGGGVAALTTANLAAAGSSVPFTAITTPTPVGVFTSAQRVGVKVSAVTAFVEGQASIVIYYKVS